MSQRSNPGQNPQKHFPDNGWCIHVGFVKRIIMRRAFQWALNFSSQWDHVQMNYFYVITFMFCSDTLAVQQLGLRTSWCHFHHSLRFLPPRATHTTALWQLFTFLTTLYELKLHVLTCPQAFSSSPRILHIFDNCILRPATQLNWSWLSLSLWLSCSQRQWTLKTGLVDQPFTGYMCPWYLAAQKGHVSNKYLFSQEARPEHCRGFMSCLLNFSEYNSCCDLLENSSPTEIPSHQRSPTFRNTAHRTEYTTLDATLLG